VKRKLIDPELVDDLISSGVIGVWEKIEPVVLEWRVRRHYPQLMEYFEYRAREMYSR
jgi:hypothetical protein